MKSMLVALALSGAAMATALGSGSGLQVPTIPTGGASDLDTPEILGVSRRHLASRDEKKQRREERRERGEERRGRDEERRERRERDTERRERGTERRQRGMEYGGKHGAPPVEEDVEKPRLPEEPSDEDHAKDSPMSGPRKTPGPSPPPSPAGPPMPGPGRAPGPAGPPMPSLIPPAGPPMPGPMPGPDAAPGPAGPPMPSLIPPAGPPMPGAAPGPAVPPMPSLIPPAGPPMPGPGAAPGPAAGPSGAAPPADDNPNHEGTDGPFSAADADGNGDVTLAEIEAFADGSPHRTLGLVGYFAVLDTDGNEQLDADELAGAEPATAFDSADLDGDGIVTLAEVTEYGNEPGLTYRAVGVLAMFAELDTNDDDVVDADEILAAHDSGLLAWF